MESWRTTKHRIVFLRICLLLSSGASALHFDQCMAHAVDTPPNSPGKKYSIAEIRTNLREQLTSLHSIWCEYKVQSSSDYDRNKPDTWPTFVWAQQNSRVLHRMLPHQPRSLKGQWEEEFESFDGQTGYRVLFHREEKSLQQQIQRTVSAPPTLSNRIIPAHHLGLVVSGTTLNLLALIDRPGLIAVAGPTINGHATIQIDFGPYIPGNHLIVFFDPQFDFLPRRIASLPARVLNDLGRPGASNKFEGQPDDVLWQIGVDTFMEVRDPVLNRTRWIPQRLMHSNQVTAFVTNVRFNEELPHAAFRPVIVEGATIIDNPGTPKMRESTHGTLKSNQSVHHEVTKSANISEKDLTAELPSTISWFSVSAITAFVAISGALIFSRRRV